MEVTGVRWGFDDDYDAGSEAAAAAAAGEEVGGGVELPEYLKNSKGKGKASRPRFGGSGICFIYNA